MRIKSLILILLIGIIHPALAGQPRKLLLWPDQVPHSQGSDPKKDIPFLLAFQPPAEKLTKTAVIVCPGGGYFGLADGHEGRDIAKWLNSLGVTAFVLNYRRNNGGYQHPVPLLDAQRAIRLVRSRAAEFKINSDKIGIMGFSAGGHLASTTGTHFDKGEEESSDPIEHESSRPDFMILCYPVITMGQDSTHKGSQRNLLGDSPSEALLQKLSSDQQVTSETPPTFLFHTSEDTLVSPENSTQFYLALLKAGVPAELHIYRKGRHGIGLAPKIPETKSWPKACEDWMRGHEWL